MSRIFHSYPRIVAIAGIAALLFATDAVAQTRWACIGDSITAAWKLKETDGYCYKLGVLLGNDYETANFGHSARTMLRNPNEGYPYWESPLFIDSQNYLPGIVSLMLGTNDAHPNNWPELSAAYQQDAIDLVNVYKSLPSKPRVILMTIPPAKDGNSRNAAIVEVNAILEHVAQVTGVELADVHTELESSGLSQRELFKDPIHLNGPAHTVIADLLFDQVSGSGPTCGNGICEATETPCNCSDCGIPPATETSCSNAIDDDCDGAVDCADGDCLGGPSCPVGSDIFSDDFESGDFAAGGWTTSGRAQVATEAAADGNYGARLQRVGSIEAAVSTAGRIGIVIEYDRVTQRFEPADDSLDVEWYDGQSWQPIESTADSVWGFTSVNLPAGADNNPDFRIRFICNGNHPVEKAFIDNVQILD
jgi:lysophospholipase L1-like esterase